MTAYYVKIGGNDSLDGKTDATAWATVNQVQTRINSGYVTYGDTVKFRRGDEFGGVLSTPTTTVRTGPRISFGSYGVGARPKISAYKIANISGGWVLHATGVYKLDLSATGRTTSYTGNIIATSAEVGFLKVSGVIQPNKVWTLGALTNQWDFYNDTQYVYVKSTANPTTLATDIRVACVTDVFAIGGNTAIYGLDIGGSGSHGIRVVDQGNVIVMGNDIHECGGGSTTAPGGGTTRYGNGVEFWIGCSDCVASYNDIHDVYDTAVTFQGQQVGGRKAWTRVHYRYNRIWNCTQALEYWSSTDGSLAGDFTNAGSIGCSFERNVCINSGYSWGRTNRDNTFLGKGAHILLYAQDLPVDVSVKQNTFLGAYENYATFANTALLPPTGFACDDNEIFLRPSQLLSYQQTQTVETPAAWSAAVGIDANSRFYTLPDTPLTVDDGLQILTAHVGSAARQLKTAHRATAEARAEIASLQGEFDNRDSERILGIPFTPAAFNITTNGGLSSTNRGLYSRLIGVGEKGITVTGFNIRVGTSSGNICVALYSGTGSGTGARPVTQKATTGSIACPATGDQAVTLACTVAPGDWLFIAADNTTAQFGRGPMGAAGGAMHTGLVHYQDTAFPAPATATPSAAGFDFVLAAVGITS